MAQFDDRGARLSPDEVIEMFDRIEALENSNQVYQNQLAEMKAELLMTRDASRARGLHLEAAQAIIGDLLDEYFYKSSIVNMSIVNRARDFLGIGSQAERNE